LKIQVLEIRGALENCRLREDEEDGIAVKRGFIFPPVGWWCSTDLSHHAELQMLLPRPWVLAPYYIHIMSRISFQEEQIFSSATRILKEQGIFISDASCDTGSNMWLELSVQAKPFHACSWQVKGN